MLSETGNLLLHASVHPNCLLHTVKRFLGSAILKLLSALHTASENPSVPCRSDPRLLDAKNQGQGVCSLCLRGGGRGYQECCVRHRVACGQWELTTAKVSPLPSKNPGLVQMACPAAPLSSLSAHLDLSAVRNDCPLRCSKFFSFSPSHDKIPLTICSFRVHITLCGRFVSLEDAERTIKTGQPPEMRMEVSATATAPQPPRAAAAAAAETARPAPAQNGPAAPAEREKVHCHQTHGPCHRTAFKWS